VIRATYYLGATITVTVPPEDAVLLDQLADLALAAADAALADVASDVAEVVLVGPPYVEDVEDLQGVEG